MSRRDRTREAARARRRAARRHRPPEPPAARIISLTPARRRAAARRRLEKGGAGAPRREAPRAGRLPADFPLATCVAGARAGARVVMHYWGRRAALAVREKGRADYVTTVDREAEETIVRLVGERFPAHAIIAEEAADAVRRGAPPRPGGAPLREPAGTRLADGAPASAGSTGPAGYRWYVDPLDGTTNYLHGYPLFCVSIGFADPQGMRAAAIYDPVRDEMFTAARGQGAFLNGEPIRVSAADRLQRALLVTGIPFRSLARLDQYLVSFRSFILGSGGIRRDGSAALDLAYVACGRYDGFWEQSLSSWDVAAGSLIVKEAGGTVTDFEGRDGYLDSGDIIASAPSIHPAMLRVVREAYRR
jgi:myo-inositol-1(or 4)-monophosphatase